MLKELLLSVLLVASELLLSVLLVASVSAMPLDLALEKEIQSAKTSAITFSPNGSWLALSHFDDNLYIFETENYQVIHTVPAFFASNMEFTPDGQQIALAVAGTNTTVFNISDWSSFELDCTSSFVTIGTTGISACGQWPATTGVIYDSDWEILHTIGFQSSLVQDVIFSDNGSMLFAAAGVNGVKVFNTTTGINYHNVSLTGATYLESYGNQLIVGKNWASTTQILVYDTDSWAVLAQEDHGLFGFVDITELDLSPDNTVVVTIGEDDRVRLWNTTTWEEERVFPTSSGISAIDTSSQDTLALGDFTAEKVYILTSDMDGDGIPDTEDDFPEDHTQTTDADSDNYGDNASGYSPDFCPQEWGNSTMDYFGCPDLDGDGYSNVTDPFPLDDTQWADYDNDGFGDNLSGTNGDYCPFQYGTAIDLPGCPDADSDGVNDYDDEFPLDPSESADSDQDGVGDNADPYPNDRDDDGTDDGLDFCPLVSGNSTIQGSGCPDQDGDGWADQIDSFPQDKTQWQDRDGDLHGDNPSGTSGDLFPDDPNQWEDADRDGLGDNPGYPFSDPFPNDRDNDGHPDGMDDFPLNPFEWNDTDSDGLGDNQDLDDDNDCYPDSQEQFANTNPLDNTSTPPDMDGDCIADNLDDDTDGDGYSNRDEIAFGSDPYNQTSVPGNYSTTGPSPAAFFDLTWEWLMYVLSINIALIGIWMLIGLVRRRHYREVKGNLNRVRDPHELDGVWYGAREKIVERKIKGAQAAELREIYEHHRWKMGCADLTSIEMPNDMEPTQLMDYTQM